MGLSVKKLLQIRNREDFYGKKILIDIIVAAFFVILNLGYFQMKVFAHILILLWITICTQQMFTLFKRKGCYFIYLESQNSYFVTYWYPLVCSLIENSIYLLLEVIVMCFRYGDVSISAVCITLVIHYTFAIALGALSGNLPTMFAGIIFPIVYYIFQIMISGSWAPDEQNRMFSLSIQLYNFNYFQLTNALFIVVLIICMMMITRIISHFDMRNKFRNIVCVILIYVISLSGIVTYEISVNSNMKTMDEKHIQLGTKNLEYKMVEKDAALEIANIIMEMQNECENVGITTGQISTYNIQKYYVSSFMPISMIYRTRPMPVDIKDDTFFVNVFSDGMINFNEMDISINFLDRVYEQLAYNLDSNIVKNKYVRQMIDGCRYNIELKVVSKGLMSNTEELVNFYQKGINRRKESAIWDSNFLKKITNILLEKYPEEFPVFFQNMCVKVPKTDDEVFDVFKQSCPVSEGDSEINHIMDEIKKGK